MIRFIRFFYYMLSRKTKIEHNCLLYYLGYKIAGVFLFALTLIAAEPEKPIIIPNAKLATTEKKTTQTPAQTPEQKPVSMPSRGPSTSQPAVTETGSKPAETPAATQTTTTTTTVTEQHKAEAKSPAGPAPNIPKIKQESEHKPDLKIQTTTQTTQAPSAQAVKSKPEEHKGPAPAVSTGTKAAAATDLTPAQTQAHIQAQTQAPKHDLPVQVPVPGQAQGQAAITQTATQASPPPAAGLNQDAKTSETATTQSPTTVSTPPAMPGVSAAGQRVPAHQIKVPIKRRRRDKFKPNMVDFTFDNADLSELVKRYAEKKKINVILPLEKIDKKITFHPDGLLTLDEAKRYLYMFLDYAGYTVIPGPDFRIVAKSVTAQRNNIPLYVIGAQSKTKVTDLPDSDEPVRAVFYVSNLKVDAAPDNAVLTIVREMLTDAQNVFVDPAVNAIVITDKSRVVRAAIQLLQELDASGTQFVLTTLQLYNANAASVTDLLKTQILAVGGRFGEQPGAGMGSYFSTNLRVVPDVRRNMLIIMGKEAPVNRLKEFVREYMDAPLESGKSIFHVYDLKYLDAQAFADTLTNVVTSAGIGGPGAQAAHERVGGVTRLFEGVAIKAETYKAAETAHGEGGHAEASTIPTGTVYKGGNRLLIAAHESDWLQIKKLVDQLDVPQRQVIVEVLIVDYTRLDTKAMQSQVRSTTNMNLSPGVGFQSAHAGQNILPTGPGLGTDRFCPVNPPGCPPGTNLTGDLLRIFGTPASTLISPLAAGSTILSFNDPANLGIWGILSVLNQIGHTKVLSHPYLMALNNVSANVYNKEIRRDIADASSSMGGAINVNVADVSATLDVSIVPRIASIDHVNLEITVKIEQFTGTSGFDRQSRTIQTNVNMKSPNQVLVLGGLERTSQDNRVTKTPILGDIPIFGALFRGVQTITEKSELAVFIRPTIVEPKISAPMDEYTNRKISNASATTIDGSYIGNQRDPIIRFFFGQADSQAQSIADYQEEIKTGQVSCKTLCPPR